MSDLLRGRIVCSKSGFYYIDDGCGKIYTSRARGRFRKDNISPVVGDEVMIRIAEDDLCYVDEILPRRNMLKRPNVANIDKLFIISSVVKPVCDLLINDKLCAVAEYKQITPVVVFTKCDLAPSDEFARHYEGSGVRTYSVSGTTGQGVDELRPELTGLCVFTGNTGAGKSTLLNALCPELELETGEISDKLGRGRHTTRTVELFRVHDALIADTPGFSSPELSDTSEIGLSDLADCFPEFREHIFRCRFASDCAHIKDAGCAIKKAVEDGLINESRWKNYVAIYEEKRLGKKRKDR